MSKKGRGKTMSLAAFSGGTSHDDLRWAEDEFQPALADDGPAEGADTGKKASPTDKKDRKFGFVCGTMENFRETGGQVAATVVPEDMTPPFVAYVGNLPHKITPDTVQTAFDEVAEVRVVAKGNITFAYVEFETRQALQVAILMTGKNIGGRKIKVDVASQAQRDRLEAERNGTAGAGGLAVLDREVMGEKSPTSPLPPRMPMSFSRDDMGAVQPDSTGLRGMGMRAGSGIDLSNFSREDMGAAVPTSVTSDGKARAGEGFSRDDMGSAKLSPKPEGVPTFGGGFARRGPASPASSGAPRFPTGPRTPVTASTGLGSWRSDDKVEQPASGGVGSRAMFGRGGARAGSGELSTPTSGAAVGSWRSPGSAGGTSPVTEAPSASAPVEKKESINSWRAGPPVAAKGT